MELNDILRASFVKRWIITPTAVDQSLAEHTFNVVMIARHLAKKWGIPDENIIKAAIVHDLDEILTGDIPTPLKVKAKDAGVDLNSLYYNVTKRTLSAEELLIISLADKMEAIWFIENFNCGMLGRQVSKQLLTEWYAFTDSLKVDGYGELAELALETLEDILGSRYIM